jgi:catechol 2,3-dioxygenase-like lactoylglutathione lyase family enzyme
MLRVGSVVWGVRDVPRAIEFWCEALDYRPREEPGDDWAVLVPESGPGVQVAICLVTSDAETHQRHHLDLYSPDRPAEVARLQGIGAHPVAWVYPADADYTVLADPDGNRFCVADHAN